MADLAALTATARAMLPAFAAVAATDPTHPAALFADEALPGAVPKRQREFAAGRAAARAALKHLGHNAAAIPIGPDRAPIWPDGVTGSITHSATLCLAAVTHQPRLLGIDIEPMTALEPDLWDAVLLPVEQAALRGNPNAPMLAKLIFSAKEAAYKAQYARSKTILGFDAVHISLSGKTFTARFMYDVQGFAAGSTLTGRAEMVQNHILTTICT